MYIFGPSPIRPNVSCMIMLVWNWNKMKVHPFIWPFVMRPLSVMLDIDARKIESITLIVYYSGILNIRTSFIWEIKLIILHVNIFGFSQISLHFRFEIRLAQIFVWFVNQSNVKIRVFPWIFGTHSQLPLINKS
jgi:hypothetical protein